MHPYMAPRVVNNATVTPPSTSAQCHPGQRVEEDRARFVAAAARAQRLWGGAIGEHLSRELNGCVEMNLRFDKTALVYRLVDQILATPDPGGNAA